jgi:hypothetical protein
MTSRSLARASVRPLARPAGERVFGRPATNDNLMAGDDMLSDPLFEAFARADIAATRLW